MPKYKVQRSKKYKEWYRSLTEKEKAIVDTRIDFYVEYGVLVKSKLIDREFALCEFKWNNGLRIYFSLIEDKMGRLLLLLIGGNKNSQSCDIILAKNVLFRAILKIKTKK
jgi:putative addiction module killer protein